MARVTIRLTSDNLDDLRKGDVIVGAEDMGPVRSVRLTRDGYEDAMVYWENDDRDVFGLPQTITVVRDA